MIQFALRFGFFCALLVLGLSIFSIFLKVGQKNYDSYACFKLKKFLDEKSIDSEILVFGSSVAEGAINPIILSKNTNRTTYNAALSGRRIIDWNSVAFSFIDYTKKNKIIILDIFPNVFNETNQLYQPHEFYPYLDNKFVKSALAPISPEYYKMTKLPFYFLTQLNSKILLNSISSIQDMVFNYPSNIPMEYLGYKNIDSEFQAGQLSNLIAPEISTNSIRLYEEMFFKSNKKGIKVILVGMPVFKEGKEFYPNLDSVYNWGEVWDEKYSNVKFINFLNDSSVFTNENFFANYTHLNNKGATTLSEKIANYIVKKRW